ncbi:MAG: CPBP family intramembrane glutamic endopeptidase [Actinomycetes bacterium]
MADGTRVGRAWTATVASVVVLLAVSNVVANRVLPEAWYIPWNLAVAAVLVVVARRVVTDAELGLGEWRRGAAFGGVLFGATLVVMLVALAMPVFRQLYEDRRVDDDLGAALFQALVRVPFGTVLMEEVAFRGVLPALLALRWGVLRGCLAASVLFGLWHVLPAWNLNDSNAVAGDVFGTSVAGTAVAVLFAVVGTTIAGCWWCWIRVRSRSVLSTILAHTATNSIGYLLAFVVTR